VTEAVKTAMKGEPDHDVDRAVRQAVRDVLFLFHLCQQLNFTLLEESKYLWTRARLIATEFEALQREQAFRDERALDRMQMAMELSYPLDPETASAVAAAQKHHVMSWKGIEEGDDLDGWLLRNYLAEGKMALPDGAYLVRDGIESRYRPIPSPDEVRNLFVDEDSFRKFQDAADYSYGLADVPDAVYEARYEELLQAVKGVAKAGTFVDLPTVPHDFLREAPLIDGEWIDLHVVNLAEWGARICKNGHALEDPEDNHPMAWCRIVGPTDGSTATDAATRKPWHQTSVHLSNFPGRTREIEGRPYVSFADYVKWESRHAMGNLKFGFHDGIVVSDWNQWVDAEGREGATILAGVTVGKLRGYSENYRHHVCRDAEELADETSRRDSLLDSLRPGRPGSLEKERYLKRVGDWKDQAENFLTELYTMRRATEIVEQLYFDGQPSLFVEAAEGLDQLVALVQELIDGYNEDLASRLEDQQKLLSNVGSPVQELPLIIDLTRVTGKIDGLANDWVAYFVDMAKAEALGLIGETERAAVFADRHF